MTIPAGSVVHDSLAPHFRPAGTASEIPASEIERLQIAHDFSRLPLYFVAILAAFFAVGAESIEDWLCAMMILLAVTFPIVVWAKRWILGLPLQPVFGIACLIYYAFPFVNGHPTVQLYDASEKLFAAGTVAVVLLIMAGIWAWLGRPRSFKEFVVQKIDPAGANRILMICLAGACMYQMNAVFWFVGIPDELYGVVRAILYTLGVLSVFALSNQLGAGMLRGNAAIFFLGMLAVLLGLNILTLYLYTAMEIGIFALLGYFLGRGRLPWKAVIVFFAVFAVLHAGKSEMRERYWGDQADSTQQVGSSLGTVIKWFELGIASLVRSPEGIDESAPLIQRASLIHLLLKAQTETPELVPYLYGATYLPIPFLLVPRIFWPERPNAQETLVQLNVHYGLLTREMAETTSIGWGMISEAYANFGTIGCIALGIVLGIFMGMTQRLCGRFPVLSARGLAGLVVLMTMLRSEPPMALFLSSLLQSFFPLLLLAWTIMRPSKVMA